MFRIDSSLESSSSIYESQANEKKFERIAQITSENELYEEISLTDFINTLEQILLEKNYSIQVKKTSRVTSIEIKKSSKDITFSLSYLDLPNILDHAFINKFFNDLTVRGFDFSEKLLLQYIDARKAFTEINLLNDNEDEALSPEIINSFFANINTLMHNIDSIFAFIIFDEQKDPYNKNIICCQAISRNGGTNYLFSLDTSKFKTINSFSETFFEEFKKSFPTCAQKLESLYNPKALFQADESDKLRPVTFSDNPDTIIHSTPSPYCNFNLEKVINIINSMLSAQLNEKQFSFGIIGEELCFRLDSEEYFLRLGKKRISEEEFKEFFFQMILIEYPQYCPPEASLESLYEENSLLDIENLELNNL